MIANVFSGPMEVTGEKAMARRLDNFTLRIRTVTLAGLALICRNRFMVGQPLA